MHDHRQLRAWRESRAPVLAVDDLTRRFPDDERFGLTAQIRRAAVSIPSNIAEGAGRGSGRSLAHFLRMAAGSASELETQIEIATDLGFVTRVQASETLTQVATFRRMLWGLERHHRGRPER